MWQKTETKNETKFKNWNVTNSTTQNVTKLKKSKCDKTQNVTKMEN